MGTYFILKKKKESLFFFNRKNVLALSVTWLKNKKKGRGEKKVTVCS